MKKILLCYLGRNGAGPVYSYEMAKALIENGNEVSVVISSYIENLTMWQKLPVHKLIDIKTYSSKISYAINSTLFGLRQRKKIKKVIGNEQFDLMYIPMMSYWDAKLMNCVKYEQLVTTVHDPIPHSGESKYNKRIMPSVTCADKLVALSNEFVDYMKERFGKPVIMIPHGRFNYYKDNFGSQNVLSKNATITNFLFFGRITEYKGLKILANAFKLIQDKMNDYRLTVAGPGMWSDYEQDFKGVNNLDVINKWFGAEDINKLYLMPNVVTILPYIDATQSGIIPVAKEYFSPVIASDSGGLKEQIEDNVTGLLSKTSDSQSLAEAILKLYSDKKLRDRLAQNAYNQLEELSWDKLAKKMLEEIYVIDNIHPNI